jgi:serine/threonine protein kinase
MLQSQQVLQERYSLKEQLGRTGPGRQTWLATDLQSSPKQLVIIKLLAFNPQMQWEDVKLFERESQVLKHLNHPRIPRYRDYFAIDEQIGAGLPWFALVQDYIPGQSLQDLLDQGKQISEKQATYLAQDVLEILIHLHELSPPVLHRDIKPSNLILSQDKQFYLVDFGAVQDRAKAEGASFTVVGTSGYAAPEQLWGKPVAASDLYALGATLVHLLTGVSPGDLPQRNLRIQFRDRLSLTPGFARWLEQLLDPTLERRFSGARQALEVLHSYAGSKRQLKERNSNRVRYLRLLMLSWFGLVFSAMILFPIVAPLVKPNFLNRTTFPPALRGKSAVDAINQAQQAYFLEKNTFANSLEQLKLEELSKSTDYKYLIRKTDATALGYGVALRDGLKSYVGGVFVTPTESPDDQITPDGTTPKRLLCETITASTDRPPEPSHQKGQLVCSEGTTEISRE